MYAVVVRVWEVAVMAAPSRYADWKAPADDGAVLIWPEPGQLLQDASENGKRLHAARSVHVQHVPLPELRRAMREWFGHTDDAKPLIATGHQTELYHPGVWVKNALIDAVGKKLGGGALHVAVDSDEPKHLSLRWPGGSAPLSDQPAGASWSGLLDAPSPGHVQAVQREIEQASRGWNFRSMAGEFFDLLAARIREPGAKLAASVAQSLHALDQNLGLNLETALFSPTALAAPYLVFAYHVLSRADDFAGDYNGSLEAYRVENRVRTPGRPMPNLHATEDECEVPFWLDDLASGERYRAAVLRMGDRWVLRPPGEKRRDDIFSFDPSADGWRGANELLAWVKFNQLRLSPRALTLTMILRLLVADQFVHGIGGARYDQVTDTLISRHFKLEPPGFAVTTATLYFPGAAGRTRACVSCVLQEGHRLRHSVLGSEKHQLVQAIAAAPRRSTQRSTLFSEMHSKLNAAARHPEIVRWEQRRAEAEAQEIEDRVVFDRELFYAMQPRDRLETMIAQYRGDLGC
jgi:hypothetical protein